MFPVWKTIVLGTSSNSLRLSGMLREASVHQGTLAESWLKEWQPLVAPEPIEVDLVNLSRDDLRVSENPCYASIFSRPLELGLHIVDEVAPQLALQYGDQPLGETLYVPANLCLDLQGERRKTTIQISHNRELGRSIKYKGFYAENTLDPSWRRFIYVQPRS